MERVKLSDDIEFSRIAYGMWRLTDDPNVSSDHVRKKIDLCLDQGITTFDQADIYGDYGAEEVFGKVLKQDKSLRGQMEIVTKCDIIAPIGKFKNEKVKYYDTSKEHLTYSVDSSLANMCIEQIDLLLIHRIWQPGLAGSAMDRMNMSPLLVVARPRPLSTLLI